MMNWGQRRAMLAKERRWAQGYASDRPELKVQDVVKGAHAVFSHAEGCKLHSGGSRCTCKPHIRFFAGPSVTQNLPLVSLSPSAGGVAADQKNASVDSPGTQGEGH